MLVRGAEDAAQKAGYSVLLCNSDDNREKEEQYLELLLAKRVDGILLNKAPGSLSSSLRHLLAESEVPVVSVMRTSPDVKGEAVITDDEKGEFEAVSHLARVDHRRIALVSGLFSVSNGKARQRGFYKALEAAGLKGERDLVMEGDYHIDAGYRAGLSLLPRWPDAVFVANYLMTVGVVKAADEMGLTCPEDFGLSHQRFRIRWQKAPGTKISPPVSHRNHLIENGIERLRAIPASRHLHDSPTYRRRSNSDSHEL
jgi:LacI family transcriptional regulator